MSEKARGFTPGFGEFFTEELFSDFVREQSDCEALPRLSTGEPELPKPCQPKLQEFKKFAAAAQAVDLFTPARSAFFQASTDNPETSGEKEIWRPQFNAASNPVVTKLYRAFLREGIKPEQIAGERGNSADTTLTASDVLAYLDKNSTAPAVRRALKSRLVGMGQLPWLDRKGKILPKYANQEFQDLSFTQKIAAYCAEQARGEKTLRYLFYAAWWEPARAARHAAIGNYASQAGDEALAESAFLNAWHLDPNLPGVRESLQNSVRRGALSQLVQAEEPLQKLFYAIRVDLLEGRLPAAKLKMAAFKTLTEGAQNSVVRAQREEVRGMLRRLSWEELGKLAESNEALKAQRLKNLELNLYDERTAAANADLLGYFQKCLESGAADTLEEAAARLQVDHERLQREFWKNPVVKGNWAVSLPYREPRYGSIAHRTEREAAAELVRAFKASPEAEAFLQTASFEAVPFVRLEGGLVTIPMNPPPAVRVVIGRTGGQIRMGEYLYTFPPGDKDRAVVLTQNYLLAPQLKHGADYEQVPHYGVPAAKLKKTTRDYAGGHPDSLAELVGHWKHLGTRDPDFKLLLDLETAASWKEMDTAEGRRTRLLATAEELRHRNGSYLVTAEILEGLFAADLETALQEIPPAQISELRRAAEAQRVKVELQVVRELSACKAAQPEIWKQRFPDSGPSREELDAMVDQALDGKVAIQVRKLAFARLESKYRAGGFADPIAAQAWESYEDLKDPLDKTWNLADESWDRIVDEVVITAVTLPVTMGVGSLIRGSLSATTLALRWSARGGLQALTMRTAIFTAGALGEGIAQEGFTSVLYGSSPQLKNVGFNTVMSFAFHGGSRLWGRAAGKLGLDEAALRAARARGEHVLGRATLDFAGSMATQTMVATGASYAEDLVYGPASEPKGFWERVGAGFVRMVGYHYGTKVVKAATGKPKPSEPAALEEGQKKLPELEAPKATEEPTRVERRSPAEKTLLSEAPAERTQILVLALHENQAQAPRRGTYSHAGTQDYGPHAAHTDEGIGYKSSNEDGFVQGKDWALVLDGMGGMKSGDQISRIAGQAFTDSMTTPGSEGDLARAMFAGHQAVRASSFTKGGTVAVAHRILTQADGSHLAQIVHVGDASAILLRPKGGGEFEMVFRTVEQSAAAEKRAEGKLNSTLEMRASTFAHEVTGGLGLERPPQPVINKVPLQRGDVLLMFSDGIGDNFSKAEFLALAKKYRTPAELQKAIVSLTHAKMERLKLVQSILEGQVKSGGRIVSIRNSKGKLKRVVQLDAMPKYYIDGRGNVYSAKSGKLVDHYKADNLTIHVYLHEPVGPTPKPDIHDQTTRIFSLEKTEVLAPPTKLTLRAPAKGKSVQVDGVTIWKREDGISFIQNAQDELEVFVGQDRIPHDPDKFFHLHAGEEVRIGKKVYTYLENNS
jgi:serine/threonine protein phosphatase PrpC